MYRTDLIHTTAFRLLLRYAGFVSLVALVCFGVIYWVTIQQLHTQIDAGLRAEVTALARLYDLKGVSGLQKSIAALSTTKSLAASNSGDAGPRQYLLVNAQYHRLAGSLGHWPTGIGNEDIAWATLRLKAPRNLPELDAERHYFTMRAVVLTLPDNYHLLVGQSLNEIAELQHTILALSIAAVLIVLCAGLIGGLVVGRGVVSRLREVTDTTGIIMAGDLSQRIPEGSRQNEFESLARAINAMLERIEQLMRTTREVTENVAHDLRSPLTRLRAHAEMALMHGDEPRQREALHHVIEEADGIVATLNAILSIARIEAGERHEWRQTDLETICRDAADLYEALAEEKDIRFDVAFGDIPPMKANSQLIAQAIVNLLDNAFKYTPAGGRVELRLASAGAHYTLTVADSGPGIAPELREKALERFVRLDESRSLPGNGLGLSLVQAVVRLHNGRILLEDNGPGLRVLIRFPLQAGKSAASA